MNDIAVLLLRFLGSLTLSMFQAYSFSNRRSPFEIRRICEAIGKACEWCIAVLLLRFKAKRFVHLSSHTCRIAVLLLRFFKSSFSISFSAIFIAVLLLRFFVPTGVNVLSNINRRSPFEIPRNTTLRHRVQIGRIAVLLLRFCKRSLSKLLQNNK